MYWSNVETAKGEIIFPANYIINVNTTLNYGIELLIILDYMNNFYDNGLAPYTDEGRKAFANYCYELVKAFSGKIKYFEVWNEPNVAHFWPPAPNPQNYFLLLKEAYQACKKANPESFILGCCTSGVDLKFIETVLSLGGSSYMDGISVHPYVAPLSPEKGVLKEKILELKKLMDKYGMGEKEFWVTEIGWTTSSGYPGVTIEAQANFLLRSYIELLATNVVDRVFWYQYHPDGYDEYDPEQHFGLFYVNNVPKNAFYTYSTMVKMLSDAKNDAEIKFYRELYLHPEAKAYRFKKGKNKFITIIWSTASTTSNLELCCDINKSEQIVVTSRDGDDTKIYYSSDTKFTITASEAPIYVETSIATYTISGYVRDFANIGIENAIITLSGEMSKVVLTNKDGYYEFLDLQPGNYIVTPMKQFWHFTPQKYIYAPLSENKAEQNFVGIPIQAEVDIGEANVSIFGGVNGYINPTRGEYAAIVFKPPEDGEVSIKIYTLSGENVWETTKYVSSGREEVIPWYGNNSERNIVCSGVYLIHIKGAGINIVRKLIVVK
jgi:hypothetical protein